MKKRRPDSELGVGGREFGLWDVLRYLVEEVSKIRRLRQFLVRPDFVKTDARPGTLSPSPRHETTLNASEGASLATPGNHPGLAEASSPRSSAFNYQKSRLFEPIAKTIEPRYDIL
jgi:hypothetical protein